jgi:hypothetical protein
MARRRNLSDLLESRYECPVSWDDMSGGADRRFCGQCRCEVFDLARMEPRAVKARLEASRGKMCARVTREQGRLKMLAPPSPPAELPRKSERAPALAAGLFGAWLTLAAPASAAADAPALVSFAPADPQHDGDATPSPAAAGQEAALPGGYSHNIEVTAALEVPIESVTLGIVIAEDPTLRELFADSDLVFAGRVDSAEVRTIEGDVAEVETVVRVARRFKGAVRDRYVTYRHTLPVEAFDPESLLEPLPELTPGSMVMAFLAPAEDEAGRLVYEATSYSGGLRAMAADELAAYSRRLEELAALERMSLPQGELDPAGLAEWLVAAAEDPLTRKEDTSREILSALEDLGEASEDPGELGAMVTEAHKARLAAALLATPTMTFADLELFRLVRELDPAAATLWLVETLRLGVVPDGDISARLDEFAETLDEQAAEAFLDGAEERLDAIDELSPEDPSPAAEEAWLMERQHLARPLFEELAALLEKREG